MTYRLSATDLITTTRDGPLAWERSQIPGELGIGYADRLCLDGGVSVAVSRYQPERDLLEESVVERDTPSLTVTIALAGSSSYQGADGTAFGFQAGHTTVTSASAMQGLRRYRADEDVRQLRVIADSAALRRYALDGLVGAEGAVQAFYGPSHPALARLAQTLLRCHASPAAGLLDIQIVALSVLAEQGRRMAPRKAPPAWRQDDRERMLQARDLIHRRFDQPLTVAWLCAEVGTNEFKLKQGFRELFGTTPHRMLTDVRMQVARELLAAGERVSSVAYRTGFQHPSNFSAAFLKHFGYSPKQVDRGQTAVPRSAERQA